MRAAVIDLGTNTFDLIIVERKSKSENFKVLYTDKSFVSLGEGGINEKRITEEAMQRANFALEHFIQACGDYKVESKNIHAFGTSALRDAENALTFKNFVRERFNVEISIIQGQEEANLIYQGIKGIHKFKEESCIMDIGGGSTEFIFANEFGVQRVESLNIGVSRILQRFNIPDRLTEAAKSQVETFMNANAVNLFSPNTTDTLIGAAGSFETFYQMVTKQTSYDDFSTHEIPFYELEGVLNTLIDSDLSTREQNFWIPNYRKKMIHIAAFQTMWVIRKQKIRRCYFSPAALKEGVLFSSL